MLGHGLADPVYAESFLWQRFQAFARNTLNGQAFIDGDFIKRQ
jgi:hypothetical protein